MFLTGMVTCVRFLIGKNDIWCEISYWYNVRFLTGVVSGVRFLI